MPLSKDVTKDLLLSRTTCVGIKTIYVRTTAIWSLGTQNIVYQLLTKPFEKRKKGFAKLLLFFFSRKKSSSLKCLIYIEDTANSGLQNVRSSQTGQLYIARPTPEISVTSWLVLIMHDK